MILTITDEKTGLALEYKDQDAIRLIKVEQIAAATGKDRDSLRYFLKKHQNDLFQAIEDAS